MDPHLDVQRFLFLAKKIKEQYALKSTPNIYTFSNNYMYYAGVSSLIFSLCDYLISHLLIYKRYPRFVYELLVVKYSHVNEQEKVVCSHIHMVMVTDTPIVLENWVGQDYHSMFDIYIHRSIRLQQFLKQYTLPFEEDFDVRYRDKIKALEIAHTLELS